MNRRRSWIVAFGVVLGTTLPANAAAFAPSMPICVMDRVIALPTGFDSAARGVLDRDGDGLVDAAEQELAACAAPAYHFDSGEPARRDEPPEPVLLFSVYPDGFTQAGRLRLRVSYVELYEQDGGFVYCSFPEVNGCNAHRGDAHVREVLVEVTSLTTAEIRSAAGCPTFDGTHVALYTSWGKHHAYCEPLVCDDHGRRDACDCGPPSCGLGHWDRADGLGAVRIPEIGADQNVGQAESFDYEARRFAARTPNGFVNGLAALGFAGEYVYDICQSGVCDPFAHPWKSFLDGQAWFDAPISSIHRAIVRQPSPTPVYVRADGARCGYAAAPPDVDDDSDDDGIDDACHPCRADGCGCFVDARQRLLDLGLGERPADRGQRRSRTCELDDEGDEDWITPLFALR